MKFDFHYCICMFNWENQQCNRRVSDHRRPLRSHFGVSPGKSGVRYFGGACEQRGRAIAPSEQHKPKRSLANTKKPGCWTRSVMLMTWSSLKSCVHSLPFIVVWAHAVCVCLAKTFVKQASLYPFFNEQTFCHMVHYFRFNWVNCVIVNAMSEHFCFRKFLLLVSRITDIHQS